MFLWLLVEILPIEGVGVVVVLGVSHIEPIVPHSFLVSHRQLFDLSDYYLFTGALWPCLLDWVLEDLLRVCLCLIIFLHLHLNLLLYLDLLLLGLHLCVILLHFKL